MTKTELLAVLDMSKDEQVQWIAETFVPEYGYRINFADLAFRLRDEAMEEDWCTWQIASYRVWEATHESEYNPGKFGNRAKPIDWIIAALIAKESK